MATVTPVSELLATTAASLTALHPQLRSLEVDVWRHRASRWTSTPVYHLFQFQLALRRHRRLFDHLFAGMLFACFCFGLQLLIRVDLTLLFLMSWRWPAMATSTLVMTTAWAAANNAPKTMALMRMSSATSLLQTNEVRTTMAITTLTRSRTPRRSMVLTTTMIKTMMRSWVMLTRGTRTTQRHRVATRRRRRTTTTMAAATEHPAVHDNGSDARSGADEQRQQRRSARLA